MTTTQNSATPNSATRSRPAQSKTAQGKTAQGSTALQRTGAFWDAIDGRAPMPAAAATLGWELSSISPERGEIEVFFTATEAFANPTGAVQGGFLAAMLDDTLGPALVATLPSGAFAPTLELKVNYLRPARPGRLLGRGRVVHRGGTIAFLAGELCDEAGTVLATATATARIVQSGLGPGPPGGAVGREP